MVTLTGQPGKTVEHQNIHTAQQKRRGRKAIIIDWVLIKTKSQLKLHVRVDSLCSSFEVWKMWFLQNHHGISIKKLGLCFFERNETPTLPWHLSALIEWMKAEETLLPGQKWGMCKWIVAYWNVFFKSNKWSVCVLLICPYIPVYGFLCFYQPAFEKVSLNTQLLFCSRCLKYLKYLKYSIKSKSRNAFLNYFVMASL